MDQVKDSQPLLTQADLLTKKLTVFSSFWDFCDCAIKHAYTPTLRGWNKASQKEADKLAHLFDEEMAKQDSTIRAWPKR